MEDDPQTVLGYDEFRPDLNRYHFDNGECNPTETNFCQIDTWQDAPYFGVWADPVGLRITKYIESEVYRDSYDTEAGFCDAVRTILQHNRDGEAHASIDGYGNREDWARLGFGSDLHATE